MLHKINNWLSIRNEANQPAEILIYGDIGDDIWDRSGSYATQFDNALKAIPAADLVNLRIHSRGGNVWDCFAMASMVQKRGKVIGTIDGVGASSAAILFNACSKRVMPRLAMQMIHNTRAGIGGDKKAHADLADVLAAHDDMLAQFLSERTGKTVADVKALMNAETWMNGDQAKASGFCDEVTDAPAVENKFDLSPFRHSPLADAVNNQTTAPRIVGANQRNNLMNKEEMLALLKTWGVTVPDNSTDAQIVALVKAGKPIAAPAPVAPAAPADLLAQMEATNRRMDAMRTEAITNSVNALVADCRVTAAEAPAAIARALKDESYLKELQARPQNLPGNEPLNSGLTIINEDARNIIAGIRKHVCTGPASIENAVERSQAVGAIWQKERQRVISVMNTAATNTVDASLKRVMILQEVVRDFATRVLPLRLFSSVFSNVPLQGTDSIVVPYYPLQTTASSDFTDGDSTAGYVFGQATTTNKATITVNKRKYQPIDYSSREFRFQPWFDATRLGKINAEKLGVDIVSDVLSVVTSANFGAAVKTISAAAMSSDDVADLRAAANLASWPDSGRSLLVDSTVDAGLMKDPSYKLALNIGTASVIQQGQFPNLSGFEYAWMPNLPSNSQNLIGLIAFASGILSAFCPVEPAPGVRAQLVAYEIATDPMTGISMNYRHWGVAQQDRDFEVIEACYGYVKGVTGAIKRICSP